MKKIFVALSAVIFLAAGCGQKPALRPVNNPVIYSSSTAPHLPLNEKTPDKVQQARTITVTQVVQGTDLAEAPYKLLAGKNAIDLLKLAHKPVTKSYSGLGEMVLSIDGIKPDSKQFWAFYVNGKSSSVGASSYILKNGDKVEWKLEAIR